MWGRIKKRHQLWPDGVRSIVVTIKKAAGRVLHALGGRPKAGACEFCILLWKTPRHRSVTIEIKNSWEARKSQNKFADFFGGQYEVVRA